MRFLKQSSRVAPRLSLVLVDWSVRESFHILHYLSAQTIARNEFEVVIVEYYSKPSLAAAVFQDQIDTWVLLEMPETTYYHKHLMYNAGIALARGGIVMIGDSDAIVRETFVATIIAAFDDQPRAVLHLDQFRNNRKDLYPFCYPSITDVLGPGCINNADGVTTGIIDRQDPLHARNYGACMCARRNDLIAVGGADEHIDFLGHICGPYDMTFRLINAGCREIWHPTEFMYHTWHPGAFGVDNYLGPHDGRYMSSTALDALICGRVMPLLENRAIRHLRLHHASSGYDVAMDLIDPAHVTDWQSTTIDNVSRQTRWRLARYAVTPALYRGFKIDRVGDQYAAMPIVTPECRTEPAPLVASEISDLLNMIDRQYPRYSSLLTGLIICFLFVMRVRARLFRGHLRAA